MQIISKKTPLSGRLLLEHGKILLLIMVMDDMILERLLQVLAQRDISINLILVRIIQQQVELQQSDFSESVQLDGMSLLTVNFSLSNTYLV